MFVVDLSRSICNVSGTTGTILHVCSADRHAACPHPRVPLYLFAYMYNQAGAQRILLSCLPLWLPPMPTNVTSLGRASCLQVKVVQSLVAHPTFVENGRIRFRSRSQAQR